MVQTDGITSGAIACIVRSVVPKSEPISSRDDLVRIARKIVEQVEGEDYENLDPELRQSIEEAEVEYVRGESMPVDEAFRKLRDKYLDHLGR
jgi:hypothetical protein